MIHIADTPKPRDRFGSIPIRGGKPINSFSPGPHLPRRPKPSLLWTCIKRTVGLFLFLGLVLGICSPLLVPYFATTILPTHLASILNRPVTIGRAEFDPFTFTLTLRHLIVGPNLSKPNDPVDPLLSAGKISIAFAPEHLLARELACNLNADHFFLHLVRQKEGGYNFGQTMDELLSSLPVIPLRFSLNTIAASNSRLIFDDGQTGKNHLAEEITLNISPGQAIPMSLQAKINGVPITLPESSSPSQASKPLQSPPETTEAFTLVQNLSQAARQYLLQTASPPVESRIPTTAP